ncbi:MAG: hypothetical protein JWN46_785 [Acidimicrobiales bacterium]|nr:hypothetical protein [Acidimicrobiales bacterium]
MTRRPAPRRRAAAPVVALLVVLALGASACSGFGPVGRPPAATVNGTDISTTRVLNLLKAQQRNQAIEQREAKAQKQPAPSLPVLKGDGSGTWSTAEFARTLQPVIQLQVLTDALNKRHHQISDANRKDARADLASRLAPTAATGQAPDLAAGEAALKKRDPQLVQFFVDLTAAQLALRDDLAKNQSSAAAREGQLRAAYEQQKGQLAQACLNVIVAKTQAAAAAARKRVDAGQAFTTVARQVSTDSTASTGGDAGCGRLSQISGNLGLPATTTPPAGTVIGPLNLQGSYVVVLLRSVTIPTFAQAKPTLEASVPAAGTTEAAAELAKLLAAADVHIDPRYGTWDPKKGAVVAPVAPPAGRATSTAPA